MIKCDKDDNILIDDLHNAEMISAYINNFKIDHIDSLGDFSQVCFDIVARDLHRYCVYLSLKDKIER